MNIITRAAIVAALAFTPAALVAPAASADAAPQRCERASTVALENGLIDKCGPVTGPAGSVEVLSGVVLVPVGMTGDLVAECRTGTAYAGDQYTSLVITSLDHPGADVTMTSAPTATVGGRGETEIRANVSNTGKTDAEVQLRVFCTPVAS